VGEGKAGRTEVEGIVISLNFSIPEFVDSVKALTLARIMADTEREVGLAEYASFTSKTSHDFKRRGSVHYAETLKGLLFLLRYGRKSMGVSPEDFQLFRPIIDGLVRRGELKSEALQLFEDR